MLEAQVKPDDIPLEDQRLHLLSRELEEATKLFLDKMAELEKMLPLIEE